MTIVAGISVGIVDVVGVGVGVGVTAAVVIATYWIVAGGGSKSPPRKSPVNIPTSITAMAVKKSLFFSLVAMIPLYRETASAHMAVMPKINIKAPTGRKALNAAVLSGNMRPASLWAIYRLSPRPMPISTI